jgi:peptidylprolyl isomerase
MQRTLLFFFAAAIATAASAQTPAKTTAPGATTARTPSTAKPAASTASTLPAGIPHVMHGPLKTAFALRYEDIKVGTGALAEPNKLYKVFYTGYLGANGRPDDGHKFDSTDDHRRPIQGKDGKPVLGDDGKPELGEPEPIEFPQGFGRLIPGFDQGFDSMRIGGKRRLFIPWQLAYGSRGVPGPDPANPRIPPKSDLIFDIELVDVVDLPMPPTRPGLGARPMPGTVPPRPAAPQQAPTPGQAPPTGSGTPANPSATPAQPATPPQPSAPSTPPPQSK